MSYDRSDQAYGRSQPETRRRGNFSGLKLRLLIGAAIILFSVVSFYGKGQPNPITGENQRVAMAVAEEVRLGQESVPQMGIRSRNRIASAHVEQIGNELVNAFIRQLEKSNKRDNKRIQNPFDFRFHLLADSRTVNAFALPGGQVFITEALYRALSTDGQSALDGRLAGVLGHEIGHVIERHGSERMAKGNLMRGFVQAAAVAGGDSGSSQIAAYVGNIVNMKFGRGDELESDKWGVELMILTGYNPEHLKSVMDVLEATSGTGGPPAFMSTHPRPADRRSYIEDIIAEKFPDGIPDGLR
jgi:predicted Zn-dependent protease